MQIIVNKDFSIAQVEPSTVGQGSVNGAVISVFAPFSVGQYSAVKIYAELPNGEVLEPIPAFPIPSDSLSFGAWSVLVGGALTKYPGQVKLQLVFLATGEDSQPSTGIATFTVAQGITPELPDEPDSNVYDDLLINIGELRSYFSSLFNQLPPSWVTNVSNPSDPDTPPTANAVYTFVSNIVNSLAENLAEELGEETTARENADTALGQRITDDVAAVENRLGESMQTLFSIESNARETADNDIKDLAVGIPTYDETTGKITFETLSGRYTTIDLILMSMLTNVRFDEANNEIVFSFRTHEGVESEVRVPLGDLTLPAWTTNVNTTNSEQLSVPPTTQAVKNAVSSEASTRQNADTALGQRITDDVAAVENRLGESMQTLFSIESNARETADNDIKDLAVGIPTYDETTGKITFETLSGRYTTIDLILMSMLTNVRFDEANNEIVFSFRTHEGVESEVRVPLGDLTLPAWTTNVNTTNSEQLSVPPTTQAVKNAVSSEASTRQNADTELGTRINNEATSRGNADEAIKESAVKAPTLSNNVLIFKNLNDEEMTRITLPEGGGGSSGGSCSCYSVPIQEFEYNNDDPWSPLYRSFTFTEVAENTLKAFIHIAPPESVNCGGYPDMVITSDNPFGEEGAEEIYYAFDDVADSDYDDEFNVNISITAPLTMTISYSAYTTPPSNWFIEITAKTDTREIWVYGQQMRAAY